MRIIPPLQTLAKPEEYLRSSSWLRSHFHIIYGRLWFGDRFACFSHRLEVGGESTLKVLASFFLCISNGHTSRHIR